MRPSIKLSRPTAVSDNTYNTVRPTVLLVLSAQTNRQRKELKEATKKELEGLKQSYNMKKTLGVKPTVRERAAAGEFSNQSSHKHELSQGRHRSSSEIRAGEQRSIERAEHQRRAQEIADANVNVGRIINLTLPSTWIGSALNSIWNGTNFFHNLWYDPGFKTGNEFADFGLNLTTDIVTPFALNKTLQFARNALLAHAIRNAEMKPIQSMAPKTWAPTPTIQQLNYLKVWKSSWGNPTNTRYNTATSYSWSHKPTQQFELVKDVEPGMWSAHFKTDRGALTHSEKTGLFAKLADEVPVGDKLSTWGSVSPGAISAFEKRLPQFNLNLSGYRPLTLKGSGETVLFPVLTKTPNIRSELNLSAEDINSMNMFQRQALSDLESYVYRDQFKTVPYIDANKNIRWGFPGEHPHFLKTIESMPEYKESLGRISYNNGFGTVAARYVGEEPVFYYYGKGWPKVGTFLDDLGEAVFSTGTSDAPGFARLTSPKTEAMVEGLPQNIIDLASPTIPRRIIYNYDKSINGMTRPGMYVSADEGAPPLGKWLIDMYKDLGEKSFEKIKFRLSQKPYYRTHNNGLSFDAYESIVRTGLRPGHFRLRWSEDGMGKVNDQTFNNKNLYNAYRDARSGKITNLEFIDQFNLYADRIGGIHGKILNPGTENETIWIPLPFLYAFKQGGKLNELDKRK